jgi:hypothetical protein
MPPSISELGGYTCTRCLQSFDTSQLNGDASLKLPWRTLLGKSAQCSAKKKYDAQQHLCYGNSKSLGFEQGDHLPATNYSSSRRQIDTSLKGLLWFTTCRRREQPYALSLLNGDDAISLQGLPSQFHVLLGHCMVQSNEKQCGEVSSLYMQDIVPLR